VKIGIGSMVIAVKTALQIFALVLIPFMVSAQQSNPSVLIARIQLDKAGSNKVNDLNELAVMYSYTNVDSAILLSNQALALQKK
jgi:hypothetical protein